MILLVLTRRRVLQLGVPLLGLGLADVLRSRAAAAAMDPRSRPRALIVFWTHGGMSQQDTYDLTRFVFPGNPGPADLAELLAATDLHIYLTVPFPLSTSMLDAMSCGAVVLGSATPPVQEVIADGQNGLLVDFFDVAGIADKAVRVLEDPAGHRSIGRLAEQTVAESYGLEAVLPETINLYEETAKAAEQLVAK